MVFDEEFCKRMGRRSKGNMWWWREHVKGGNDKKNRHCKVMFLYTLPCNVYRNRTEVNTNRYKSMKMKVRKAVQKQ